MNTNFIGFDHYDNVVALFLPDQRNQGISGKTLKLLVNQGILKIFARTSYCVLYVCYIIFSH